MLTSPDSCFFVVQPIAQKEVELQIAELPSRIILERPFLVQESNLSVVAVTFSIKTRMRCLAGVYFSLSENRYVYA